MSHVASAASNADFSAALIPRATIVPQQFTVCRATTQSLGIAQALSNIGNIGVSPTHCTDEPPPFPPDPPAPPFPPDPPAPPSPPPSTLLPQPTSVTIKTITSRSRIMISHYRADDISQCPAFFSMPTFVVLPLRHRRRSPLRRQSTSISIIRFLDPVARFEYEYALDCDQFARRVCEMKTEGAAAHDS